ncbi:hypothetical protein PMAC_000807 [Pneumocystis sp. 'macacae']|nr:hypothetical protein PMAC_000807 [Pneumocystis sp. 'macacae']
MADAAVLLPPRDDPAAGLPVLKIMVAAHVYATLVPLSLPLRLHAAADRRRDHRVFLQILARSHHKGRCRLLRPLRRLLSAAPPRHTGQRGSAGCSCISGRDGGLCSTRGRRVVGGVLRWAAGAGNSQGGEAGRQSAAQGGAEPADHVGTAIREQCPAPGKHRWERPECRCLCKIQQGAGDKHAVCVWDRRVWDGDGDKGAGAEGDAAGAV